MLEDRTAIIYGGSGAIGAAVAQAFARAGATVHLVGRTRDRLAAVAASIRASGGAAEIASLDVTDRSAVHAHAATVAQTAGRIDVAFNATANDDIQGTPLVDMPVSEVLQPVVKAVTAHLNIGTAMAAQMKAQQSGVILVMGGGREAIPLLGGPRLRLRYGVFVDAAPPALARLLTQQRALGSGIHL
jgi:NADP-dependent 3-hydroxy acid dehydrogenase YdfG